MKKDKNGAYPAPITIRPCTEADLPLLQAIHDPARKRELELAGLEAAFLPLPVAAEREGLFEYKVYLAELQGVPTGFVAFCEGEIAWLYVDVKMSRRGIGRQLISFALENCGADPAIEVLAGNSPALALYASLGFETAETLSGHMPGNESFPVKVHVLKRPRVPELVKLREHGELAGAAAAWFHARWGVPEQAYAESMEACLKGAESVPQWYLAIEQGRIVGGCGVIENDFHPRHDLRPNLCALYVEPSHRLRGLARALIALALADMKSLGTDAMYLVTDHVSLYEALGWTFLCTTTDNTGAALRLYGRKC